VGGAADDDADEDEDEDQGGGDRGGGGGVCTALDGTRVSARLDRLTRMSSRGELCDPRDLGVERVSYAEVPRS